MFPRPLPASLLAGALLSLAIAGPASAQGDVYHYRRADGRDVYTNAGQLAVNGRTLTPLALPDLADMDLEGASPSQLQQLDRSVQVAHEALQSGERCAAIRASSRMSTSSLLFRQYLRELGVGAALLAFALIVFAAWGGRLRALMPIAPLLGGLFLGYTTYVRVGQRSSLLHEGLRACSSDLPATDGITPSTVKSRLASALNLQATIDVAYAQQAEQVERVIRER